VGQVLFFEIRSEAGEPLVIETKQVIMFDISPVPRYRL